MTYPIDYSVEKLNQNVVGDQSPPLVVTLNDGRLLYVWSDNALADDTKTMQLQGRIVNADGSPGGDQFAFGSWAVDGTDGYDVNNLDVDVLKNGNVVVSYVRNNAEFGGQTDQPVMTILNPAVGQNDPGFFVAKNVVIEQTDLQSVESPPVVTAMADGRFFAVWSNNALADDTNTMKVQGRFFNADGTAASNQFQIGSWAVDGFDGYDRPNLTVKELTGGNLVVGYVRNTAEVGADEPVFTIISKTGAVVRADVEMQQYDTTYFESPPVISALADGRFMAV